MNNYNHTEFNTDGLTTGSSGTLNAFIGVTKYIAGRKLSNGEKTIGPESSPDKIALGDIVVGVLWRNTSVYYVVDGVAVITASMSASAKTGGRIIIADEELGPEIDVSILGGRARSIFLSLSDAQGDSINVVNGNGDYDPPLYSQSVTLAWPTQWMYVEMLDGASDNVFEHHSDVAPLFWRNIIKMDVLTDAAPLLIDPATALLLEAMVVQPSGAQIGAIDAAIVALKEGGYWDRFDRLGIMKDAKNQQHGLLDWKDPTQSLGLVGSASWNATDGACGSLAGTSYVTTGFNPTSDGINYTQNDCSINVYVTDNSSLSDNASLLGVSLGGYESLLGTSPDYDRIGGKINSSDVTRNSTNAFPALPFLVSIDRDGASSCSVYLNGVNVTTVGATNASNGLPNDELFMFAWNLSGSAIYQSNGKAAAWWAGSSFTGAERLAIIGILDIYFASM